MAKLKTIALTLSGLSTLSGAAYSHASSNNQVGMAMMRLNSSLIDQAHSKVFSSGSSLWSSLRKDFRIGEVNPELVRRHESRFSANSAYFDRTINRSKPYMFHIANEVKKRNMPAEIALLPFIESAFVTKAKSHVGASGLWQFMPATGRHFGLERTALYDGRHDVYAATNAALNYLEYLHGMFGDWSLALAAYNWGEGNVGRAVNRARAQGIEPTYENLRMPAETRNYVPKLLAVRNIVNNPQTFGMNLSEINNKPYFKTVDLDKPIDTGAIIRLANISESEFHALNPAFNAPVFIPKANRKLLLPAEAVSTFEKNYRKADPSTLLSWNAYGSGGAKLKNSIAAETGLNIADFKRIEAQPVTMARNTVAAQPDFSALDTDNTPDTYRSNMPDMRPLRSRDSVVVAAKPAAATPEIKVQALDYVRATAERTLGTQLASTEKAVNPNISVGNTVSAQSSNTQAKTNKDTTTTAIQIARATDNTAGNAQMQATASAGITHSPASGNRQNDVNVTASQPSTINIATISAIPTPAAETAVNTIASNTQKQPSVSEPLPLPTQDNVSGGETDALMALAQESEARLAENDSQSTTVNTVVEEQTLAARTVRIAENRTKQQQRINARLARNNIQTAQQKNKQAPAGMHRVADGDTLFNISQRYNLSVADLITANNIKGNNIRKGQLLNVSGKTSATKRAGLRNVAYTVRQGDTLNTIASRFNVDINDIRRWNRNTRTVTPGQRLKLMGS